MIKSGQTVDKDHPWSFLLAVAQLPDAGLQQTLEPTPAQRDLIAAAVGVNAVTHVKATIEVVPSVGGRINVTGRVQARVGQTCVVTLDPIESDVDEAIDAVFAPPSQIPVSAKSIQKDEGETFEIPNQPEPIVNGVIDLGQLALEFLVLGIDPYPRKAGVAFAPPQVPVDPDEHPFAALKALKEQPNPAQGKKPKGD